MVSVPMPTTGSPSVWTCMRGNRSDLPAQRHRLERPVQHHRAGHRQGVSAGGRRGGGQAMTSQSIDQVTDQQIADAARAVASLIEAKGKATGAFVDNMGRVCALEALKRVTVKLGVRNAVLRRL